MIMLYYSHFVIASTVTTFRFLTDMQLLYLDAVDNFLNYNSFDHEPFHRSARDHALADRALPDPTLLDLEPVHLEPADLKPADPKPLDHGSIDHPPAPLPVAVDQDNFAAAVIPVMPEPRLALLEGGKSDSVDGRTREVELQPTRINQVDAQAGGVSDQQIGQQQNDPERGWINKTAATVVVVAAGAALFEAALLPGLALGVAAIVAPKQVSRLAGVIAPIFKSTVRATYELAKKPKAAFAGAQQQINGILAEVRTEDASRIGMRAEQELRAAA
jgi:hypothetical protein